MFVDVGDTEDIGGDGENQSQVLWNVQYFDSADGPKFIRQEGTYFKTDRKLFRAQIVTYGGMQVPEILSIHRCQPHAATSTYIYTTSIIRSFLGP